MTTTLGLPELAAEINGLKQEVAEQRKLLDVLLGLVDPEDVRAAIELQRITPPHEVLCGIAERCVLPSELFVDSNE